MGKLTTHVLDTANGRPGAGIKVELFALAGDTRRALKTTTTNDDGRCDAPLLEGDALVAGEYELVFGAGDYFASIGTKVPEPRFVDRVVLRFGVADAAAHYHVPLLVSPWSYSTYRGS
ncbi:MULTISPECIES: hydroxyisourate hydrolase [Paraburkholderia]|jgi:5-hydroxyisourate hydrolase|uniref:5-hydroxyisourate hydrolase n=1 Tax=Paraburkholderia fynbosensis TaxID=1200993 RepID=A0A6J5H032_9BURK|nr:MULTISPECIES: hydroxyisourate hydrolase [Paraburkholderia]NKJ46242.1 hydroxyisourate hydrolase [Paraburkholderia sp. SG-MS1]RKT27034.1 5-hydroxyisourate hydrolase [Paraburkholderia sp. RAU2J]CAB3808385.1 5-hydroxyisourate hydrolase [Paraburkholderia fynbosensis]